MAGVFQILVIGAVTVNLMGVHSTQTPCAFQMRAPG